MRTLILDFDHLTANQKHSIINIKEECFSYTANVKVTGWDEFDQDAKHILYCRQDQVVAYCRVCAPDTALNEASFSRVCVPQQRQGFGYSLIIVMAALTWINLIYGRTTQIVVRHKMIRYYKKLGFEVLPRCTMKDYAIMQHQAVKSNVHESASLIAQ